jgi:Kef-type K+ transport system membrane component KefB
MQLLLQNIWFGILLTVFAVAGKLGGAVLGNYFCKESIKEGILIGWGLNARGATELFALLIAQSQGLVSDSIFSAIVFMALITTLVSPIIFKYLVLKGYGTKEKKTREPSLS